MTKRLLSLLLVLVTVLSLTTSAFAADGPVERNVPLGDFDWSLETIDGRTVTKSTYAAKTVLMVFYTAFMDEGSPGAHLIGELAASTWLGDSGIQVIAVEASDNDAATVKGFKAAYAPDCDQIVFALNGRSLVWQIAGLYDTSGLISGNLCAVIKDNTLLYGWDGCYSASECRSALLASGAGGSSVTLGLNVASHTAAEIQAFANAHPLSSSALSYKKAPSFEEPYSAGVLSDATLNSALNILNQIRYIAGLNANVTLNASYSEQASAGTFVNYLNRTLSHYPDRPEVLADAKYDELYSKARSGAGSSNIAMGFGSLESATVYGWMSDSDASNIPMLGHRRWLLNPSLGAVGYGYTNGYSAIRVFDRSGSGSQSRVAWPAQQTPVQYFDAYDPWSLSMGTSVNMDDVTVKLTRKADGTSWSFSSASADGYFNVNNGGYGQTGCIIFRPDSLNSINAGDVFDVLVTISDGTDTTNVAYTVSFFDLSIASGDTGSGAGGSEQLATPKITSVTADGTAVTVKWGKVDGAAAYRLFYMKNGKWTTLKDTTGTSVTLNGTLGKTYTYTVRCISADGKSYTSSYDRTGKSVTVGVATPKITSVTASGKAVTVKWGAVDGAAKYRLFYMKDGKWTKLQDTTGTSVTKNGSYGKTYTYTVRCISADGTKYTSGYDKTGVSITLGQLATPKITSVTANGKDVTVKWDAVEGAAAYRLFYMKDGKWTKLQDTTGTSVTKTGTYGKTYTYTVRCISADGKSYTSSYDAKGASITLSK